MIIFLKKSALALGFVLVFYLAAVWSTDGKSDNFYLRFTTPPASSLIVGTSRAAQGIQPSKLNPILEGSNFSVPSFNYSFTLMHSSFGPVYLKSIGRKLLGKEKNGLFILEVNPWSISSMSKTPGDSSTFREQGQLLDTVSHVNASHPNWNYFFHGPTSPGRLVLKRIGNAFNSQTQLHRNGWLEITVPMDENSVEKRSKRKFRQYSKNLKLFKFSNTRFEYLKKTIALFKKHGTPYLVRFPIAPEMQEIESKWEFDFNQMMEQVAADFDVEYLDYQDQSKNYQYTDGNHLHKDSGARFTEELAREIMGAIPQG